MFRIDHYLAKETVQNILTFRFSNSIFEPIWNNKFIDKVEIKLLEKFDVSNRGSFYDGVGALRDVGQNHILQMLSLIAMDNPLEIEAGNIRRERAKVIKALRSASSVIRGQYVGYKKTKGVKPNSKTETYFKIKALIDNKHWQGVPFILESGKALKESKVEINVYFKPIAPCFCSVDHSKHKHQNKLTFRIQPQEGIDIRFFAKRAGLTSDIEPRDLTFSYQKDNTFDAYQKVLFDCLLGDQTLFAGAEEIEASWEFISAVLKKWSGSKLREYEKGSEVFKNF